MYLLGSWDSFLSCKQDLSGQKSAVSCMRSGRQEALWHFRAPSCGVDVQLLIACHVAEPRVALSCPAHNFGRVLIGACARAALELVNDEALPFAFRITAPTAPSRVALDTGKRA